MAFIRKIAILLPCAVGLVIAIAAVARRSDGPIGPLPGGPFRSGNIASETDVSWAPLTNTLEVELQLLNPPHSRTTHIVVLDRQAYIPCGIVKVGPFVFLGQAFWKRWPYEAFKDPRVILRSNGRLYERRAVRVTDRVLHRKLSSLMSAKYHLALEEPPDQETVWFFRLEPREK